MRDSITSRQNTTTFSDRRNNRSFFADEKRGTVSGGQGSNTDGLFLDPTTPGKSTILIETRDQSGNVTTESFSFEVKTPEIILEKEPLKRGVVQGYIDPALSGIPFQVIRERNGRFATLTNESADANAIFLTDRFGKYSLSNFFSETGIVLWGRDKKPLLSFQEGIVALLSSDASLSASGGDIAVHDGSDNSVGTLTLRADGKSDLRILSEEIQSEDVPALPSGVYLFDQNTNDGIFAGDLPSTAPTFAGGAALFEKGETLAFLSSQGEIHFVDKTLTTRIKKRKTNADPLLLEIIRGENVLFDFFVKPPKTFFFEGEAPASKDKKKDVLVPNEDPTTPATGNIPEVSPVLKQEDNSAAEEVSAPSVLSYFFPRALAAEENQIFPDIDTSHPAYPAVLFLKNKGMISGYADGTFRPDDLINRAEFTKLVLAAAQCTNCTDESLITSERFAHLPLPFPDVSPDAWYRLCLSFAKFLGVVEGYGDGLFRPEDPISRAEAVAVLMRAADIPLQSNILSDIHDIPEGAWYRSEVLTAIHIGLLEGVFGFVYPEEKVSRGEFATMAAQVLETNSCRENIYIRDFGIENDLCPDVPEDFDGFEDDDGCPELEDTETASQQPGGVFLSTSGSSGGSSDNNIFWDFLSDIVPGDIIFTAIVSQDGKDIFTESTHYPISPDFFLPSR